MRASTRQWMREISISSAELDVSVREETERPAGLEREECSCPAEYSGSSCESCAPGHYRQHQDYSCLACPCHQHEDSCHQESSSGEVVCVCNRGWVGQFCQTRPINVNIEGPAVQSVRPGETVKFDCSATIGTFIVNL